MTESRVIFRSERSCTRNRLWQRKFACLAFQLDVRSLHALLPSYSAESQTQKEASALTEIVNKAARVVQKATGVSPSCGFRAEK